jgi:hypothetical protein
VGTECSTPEVLRLLLAGAFADPLSKLSSSENWESSDLADDDRPSFGRLPFFAGATVAAAMLFRFLSLSVSRLLMIFVNSASNFAKSALAVSYTT